MILFEKPQKECFIIEILKKDNLFTSVSHLNFNFLLQWFSSTPGRFHVGSFWNGLWMKNWSALGFQAKWLWEETLPLTVAHGRKPVQWDKSASVCRPRSVCRGFSSRKEKSLGPQDQQRPVESNWVWNINFPFGKRRNLHFWTIDSLPSDGRDCWLGNFLFILMKCISASPSEFIWIFQNLHCLQPLPSSLLAIGLAGWI